MEERLHKFARLVEAGSFTKASRELHISQPALSAAISKLERELKAPLLVRGPRSFQLTQAGQAAYYAAKDMAVQRDNLIARVAGINEQPLAVAIGMIDSVANALFRSEESIASLDQEQMSIIVHNSRYLRKAVENDRLDLAFVTEGATESRLLQSEHVAAEPLVLVCHKDLARRTGKELKSGRLTRFISYDPTSTSHRLIRHHLAGKGITYTPGLSSTSPDVMLRLTLLGKGATVLPYLLVQADLEKGTLGAPFVRKKPVVVERGIQVITRRKKLLATPAGDLSAQLVKQLSQQQADLVDFQGKIK